MFELELTYDRELIFNVNVNYDATFCHSLESHEITVREGGTEMIPLKDRWKLNLEWKVPKPVFPIP